VDKHQQESIQQVMSGNNRLALRGWGRGLAVFEQREEDEWIVEAKVEVLKLTEEWFKQYLGRRANAISGGSGRSSEQEVQSQGAQFETAQSPGIT
jgi:hypothetical protein